MCVQNHIKKCYLEQITEVNSFRRKTNKNSHDTESEYLVIPISSVKTKQFS